MRRELVFVAIASIALAALPADSEAFGRRCRPVCSPPVVYYSTWLCPPPRVVYSSFPHVLYPQTICYSSLPLPLSFPSGGVILGQPPLVEAAPRIITIKGKQYRIIPGNDKGDHREDQESKAPVVNPAAKALGIPPFDLFTGHSRRVAKSTIFLGPVEEFDSLGALLATLPTNEVMKAKKLDNAPDFGRVPEEQRNVRVKAYIYAFKKEPDKDYHVILGEAPGTPNIRYLNVEISGIPDDGTTDNRTKLWAVRNAFKSTLQLGNSGPRSYDKPDIPIPVRITGSLFWDVDHQNQPFVGPQSHKPKTPWEIHPVSGIEFESD